MKINKLPGKLFMDIFESFIKNRQFENILSCLDIFPPDVIYS